MTDDPLKQTPACELDRDNRILRERLRSSSPYLHGSSAERVMAEAADLIERLNAQVESERSRAIYLSRRAGEAEAEVERLRTLEPKP